MNIKLLDLCESMIVYILLSTCQWVHMTFAVNRPDILPIVMRNFYKIKFVQYKKS